MLLFPIKIQTVPELRRYVDLFKQFEVDGFLIGDHFSVPACDVLELFMYYPIEHLWLFVKEYPKGELANIEKFLLEQEIMDLERYKKWNGES